MKALKIGDRKALEFLKSVDKQKSYDRKTVCPEEISGIFGCVQSDH